MMEVTLNCYFSWKTLWNLPTLEKYQANFGILGAAPGYTKCCSLMSKPGSGVLFMRD